MIDLDALDALASAATEGPWEAFSSEATMNDSAEWRIGDRQRPQVLRSRMRAADAVFIAASRTSISALTAEVRVARQHQREASLTIRSVEGLRKDRDDALAEVSHLKHRLGAALGQAKDAVEQYQEVRAERDSLQAAVDAVQEHCSEPCTSGCCATCDGQNVAYEQVIDILATHLPDDTKENNR